MKKNYVSDHLSNKCWQAGLSQNTPKKFTNAKDPNRNFPLVQGLFYKKKLQFQKKSPFHLQTQKNSMHDEFYVSPISLNLTEIQSIYKPDLGKVLWNGL